MFYEVVIIIFHCCRIRHQADAQLFLSISNWWVWILAAGRGGASFPSIFMMLECIPGRALGTLVRADCVCAAASWWTTSSVSTSHLVFIPTVSATEQTLIYWIWFGQIPPAASQSWRRKINWMGHWASVTGQVVPMPSRQPLRVQGSADLQRRRQNTWPRALVMAIQ